MGNGVRHGGGHHHIGDDAVPAQRPDLVVGLIESPQRDAGDGDRVGVGAVAGVVVVHRVRKDDVLTTRSRSQNEPFHELVVIGLRLIVIQQTIIRINVHTLFLGSGRHVGHTGGKRRAGGRGRGDHQRVHVRAESGRRRGDSHAHIYHPRPRVIGMRRPGAHVQRHRRRLIVNRYVPPELGSGSKDVSIGVVTGVSQCVRVQDRSARLTILGPVGQQFNAQTASGDGRVGEDGVLSHIGLGGSREHRAMGISFIRPCRHCDRHHNCCTPILGQFHLMCRCFNVPRGQSNHLAPHVQVECISVVALVDQRVRVNNISIYTTWAARAPPLAGGIQRHVHRPPGDRLVARRVVDLGVPLGGRRDDRRVDRIAQDVIRRPDVHVYRRGLVLAQQGHGDRLGGRSIHRHDPPVGQHALPGQEIIIVVIAGVGQPVRVGQHLAL